MRHLTLAMLSSATIGLLLGTAMAADLPVKARPIVAPAFSWTGLYVGLNAGYSWAHASAAQNLNGFTGGGGISPFLLADIAAQALALDPKTFTGGLQAGYNHQFGHVVAGLEIDINSFRLNSSSAVPTHLVNAGFAKTTATTASIESDWLATIRGRVGYANDRFLAYVTGGAAFTNVEHSQTLTVVSPNVPASDTFSVLVKHRTGWALGAGVEYAWADQWSIKGEYLHLDFGSTSASATHTSTGGGAGDMVGTSLPFSTKLSADLVRVGVNYKFAAR